MKYDTAEVPSAECFIHKRSSIKFNFSLIQQILQKEARKCCEDEGE